MPPGIGATAPLFDGGICIRARLSAIGGWAMGGTGTLMSEWWDRNLMDPAVEDDAAALGTD